ncbi:aldo/keto reductase [Xanthomonas campestris pv. plantaginis]|uniref:aldo/keto reductase n=1 Tax=Xanthomonas campestris TaxID=339 RepID=UPI002B233192|nr:aldo/keto reductase [Xanthomonas campestris]MEA9608877.1 aldo/keto reductase [Xanthomonas campestris pv. plantaginis]
MNQGSRAPPEPVERTSSTGLAWLLHKPDVTGAISGAHTRQQLQDTLNALKLKVEPQTLERLDAIWPGPGGEAPQAYAASHAQ